MSALLKRVETEIFDLIAPEYGTVEGRVTYDTSKGTWVCVKDLPVPPSLTRDGEGCVEILLLIPDAYPQVPPDGFYCDQGLRIQNHYYMGFRDKYYPHLQQKLIDKGWQWFCAHANYAFNMSSWRPSSLVHEGDNLLKYLRLCLAILGKEGLKLKD